MVQVVIQHFETIPLCLWRCSWPYMYRFLRAQVVEGTLCVNDIYSNLFGNIHCERGDENAFFLLVDCYSSPFSRVSTRKIASFVNSWPYKPCALCVWIFTRTRMHQWHSCENVVAFACAYDHFGFLNNKFMTRWPLLLRWHYEWDAIVWWCIFHPMSIAIVQ